MTFESLCKIVDGICLNSPAVNAYEKIETKPHLIKRGDLFVGGDKEAIAAAIENGAYGILHDSDTIMIDEEIAWIKVKNSDEALIKLLRFSLLKSDFSFSYFPPIQYALLKKLAPNSLLFLKTTVAQNFKQILSAQKGSHFISQDEHFLQSIYPEYQSYQTEETDPIQVTKKTLFLTSFTYHDRHYEEMKIPSLFIKELALVLHYLDRHHYKYDLEKLDFTHCFQPIFVSNYLTIRPFGHSEHAFILVEDKNLLDKALSYTQKYATWAKLLLFVPSDIKIQSEIEEYHYKSLQEVNKIELTKFNFILILANYNELTPILEENKRVQRLSLF